MVGKASKARRLALLPFCKLQFWCGLGAVRSVSFPFYHKDNGKDLYKPRLQQPLSDPVQSILCAPPCSGEGRLTPDKYWRSKIGFMPASLATALTFTLPVKVFRFAVQRLPPRGRICSGLYPQGDFGLFYPRAALAGFFLAIAPAPSLTSYAVRFGRRNRIR